MKTTVNLFIVAIILFAGCEAAAQHRRYQTGTIKIRTSKRGTLMIDRMPVKTMTVSHLVVVTGIDTGAHTLSFKSGSAQLNHKFHVKPGMTDSYLVLSDSAVITSSKPGKMIMDSRMNFHSYYIPVEKGLYGLVKIGFSGATGDAESPFYGQVIAGYQFSPYFSLGGGFGYVKSYSHFHSTFIKTVIIYTETRSMTSSVFWVPYLPVFAEIRVNMLKKKVSPYFAFDIGCSIPLVQQIDGTYTISYMNTDGLSYTNNPMPFHINSISPGYYFGINPGLKCFVYGRYYLDLLFGWDISVNNYHGALPTGDASKWKSLGGFHMNIGFGF
ncbi:MAG: hypothetical protein NT040_16520 [Bacteroidetes bacterium]|nr:hypothetical protein [Bacteroidota bacterium]